MVRERTVGAEGRVCGGGAAPGPVGGRLRGLTSSPRVMGAHKGLGAEAGTGGGGTWSHWRHKGPEWRVDGGSPGSTSRSGADEVVQGQEGDEPA